MSPSTPGTITVQAPPSASQAIREITRLGLKFGYVPQYDLTQLTDDRRIQVREEKHYAPAANVKAFAAAMANSTDFPPVIVTKCKRLIDGSTRRDASLKNGVAVFHAIVLEVDMETSDEVTKRRVHILGATMNQANGLRLTPTEAKRQAIYAIEDGWNPQNIARAYGLARSAVGKLKRAFHAGERLDKLGIKIPEHDMPLFGTTKVLALRDKPYSDLVQLALDAGLKTGEVDEIALAISGAKSDKAGQAILTKRRAAMQQRIIDHGLTGQGKPSKASQLRRTLGQILPFEGEEYQLAEHGDEETGNDHLSRIERAIKVLKAAASYQTQFLTKLAEAAKAEEEMV